MSEDVSCTDVTLLIRSDLHEIGKGYISDLFYCPGDVILNLWTRLTGNPDIDLGGTCPSYGTSSSFVVSAVVWAGILALAIRLALAARARQESRVAATQQLSHPLTTGGQPNAQSPL